jgi:hypothetical protein
VQVHEGQGCVGNAGSHRILISNTSCLRDHAEFAQVAT